MGTDADPRAVMDRRLPEDLAAIVNAARDLARYRRVGAVADDLARSVAHELADRARRLPDHERGA